MYNGMLQLLRRNTLTLIVIFFIILDFIFLGLHIGYGEQNTYFNVDFENNAPTYYQGVKLIIIACIFFATSVLMYIIDSRSLKYLVIMPLWIGFAFLAVDEVGMFHESIAYELSKIFPTFTQNYITFFRSMGYNSTEWLLFYLPVIFGAIIYYFFFTFYFLRKENYSSRYIYLFLIASACFGAVPFIEFINTSVEIMFSEKYDTMVSIEEFVEMLGASLFLLFGLMILRDSVRSVIRRHL
jgi:hypothetical protein